MKLKAVAWRPRSSAKVLSFTKFDQKTHALKKIQIKAVQVKPGMSRFEALNLMIQDVNGHEMDFANQIEVYSQISVNMRATVDGSPASGEFVMPEGRTLIFEAGILVKIVESPINPNKL